MSSRPHPATLPGLLWRRRRGGPRDDPPRGDSAHGTDAGSAGDRPLPPRWFTEEERTNGAVELLEHAGLEAARAYAESRSAEAGSTVVVEERVGAHLQGRWEHRPPG